MSLWVFEITPATWYLILYSASIRCIVHKCFCRFGGGSFFWTWIGLNQYAAWEYKGNFVKKGGVVWLISHWFMTWFMTHIMLLLFFLLLLLFHFFYLLLVISSSCSMDFHWRDWSHWSKALKTFRIVYCVNFTAKFLSQLDSLWSDWNPTCCFVFGAQSRADLFYLVIFPLNTASPSC